MKGWLLDTNIISELRKQNCHPAVKAWADRQSPTAFYLSTITMAEIRYTFIEYYIYETNK